MSVIYIFADEAGTMPKSDDDGIFVTSAIAFLDQPPSVPTSAKARNRSQFAEVMVKQGGHPAGSLLVPYDGYKRDITDKLDQWEVMALVTHETTGTNRRYLRDPNLGKPILSRPNIIWAMYMQDAIQRALTRALMTGRKPIEEVRIVLDQKTLSKETRAHFCDQIRGTSARLRITIQSLPINEPGLILRILDWVQFDEESLRIQWEGEEGVEWAAAGLSLADTLASSIFADYGGGSDRPMIELLKECGIPDAITDRTEWVKEPVNEANRRKWERSTGARISDVRDVFKTGKRLGLKPEYRHVRFQCNESDLPAIFQIVTACNPDGQTVDADSNRRADALLAARIEEAGWRHFRVTGGSPDFSHTEPGYGIACSRDEALDLARSFGQDATFEVRNGRVYLISAKGTGAESEVVGEWSELVDLC